MKVLALALALVPLPALAQEMDHAQHAGMLPPDAAPEAVEVGSAPAPPVPSDHAADRIYPAERMERARAVLEDESRFSTLTLMLDQFEYRVVGGNDGYGWKGEAWYGGDIDRLAISTEGEGEFASAAERVELRAVWRRALDPWWNLELGLRHDFRPDPERSYAVIGIEGLAPYWFDIEGQVFISNKGDVHARGEASYDQRITQRLILQPRVELNAALQDVAELNIAAGLENIELGARLRYEIAPEFAPYVGVHWERKLGGTADLARAAGDPPSGVSLVFGIRTWF